MPEPTESGQEPTGAASSQEPASGTATTTSASAASTQQSASQSAAASQTDGEPFDRERALATIAKLREFEKQAKAQARELDQLRAAQKAADDAKLSETERLAKQASESAAEAERLRQELRQERTKAAIATAAAKHNVPTKIAERMIDVEYGDTGEVNTDALEKALKQLVADHPNLVTQQSAASPTNAARSTANGATSARTPAIAPLWDAQAAREQGGGVIWNSEANRRQRTDA